MSSVFYYTPRYLGYNLGPHHPLKPIRYRRTYDLLEGYGIFGPETPVVEPEPADVDLVRRAHTDDYLTAIRTLSEDPDAPVRSAYGLGPGDTPAFPGMWEASLLYTGASVQGAEHLLSGEGRRAHNIAGGLHHAQANRASGFCILNDAAVAIHRLLETLERVVYIDIDAHHGDGVEALFYDDPRVMTISTHESGQWLFPGTGFPTEIGQGEARGTAINIPLAPYTSDDTFLWVFHEVVPRAIEEFQPQAVVTQFGADAHFSDPLAHLALTTRSYEAMLAYYHTLGLPWLALGGGGYNIDTVPRIWSLVYAALANVDLPDELPERYRAEYGGERLRDGEVRIDEAESYRVEEYARRAVAELQRALGWD
ncbi:MAG: acetoin utilization protein AcuC [Armatimonadetes bacterium]|nr:acetoin utilization protein AcuC [Armatimonadota bacterium]